MIGLVVAILVAAFAFWILTAAGLPVLVGAIAAVLILLAGFPVGAYGGFNRRQP